MKIKSSGYEYPIPPEAFGEVVIDRDFGGSAILKDENGRKFRVYGARVKAALVAVPDTAEIVDIAKSKPKRRRKKKA